MTYVIETLHKILNSELRVNINHPAITNIDLWCQLVTK